MSDPSPTKSRSAGLLLHPTSLPGPFGVGDLGPAAFAWIDLLAAAKQSWWQILPLGMTSYGDSPYQCYSAFAGNILLVSPQVLREQGLIDENDWSGLHFPSDHVDYTDVFPFKKHLLERAWENFRAGRAAGLKEGFDAFRHENQAWLEDVVLFLALKNENGGRGWVEWPIEIRRREPAALDLARKRLVGQMSQLAFSQFLFFAQWRRLRDYARRATCEPAP